MTTIEQLNQFFTNEFPQANFIIEKIGGQSATIRKVITQQHLRPGGTVSGPVLMEVADAALYVAILSEINSEINSEIGIIAHAVTTNININFLRKPAADKDIIAECKLIKLGKTLAVGEVTMYSEGNAKPVAHATGTYAIPPNKTK